MAKIKGYNKLARAIADLKEIAEEMQETVIEKQEWLSERTDTYQDSDAGQQWSELLSELEDAIGEIDGLPDLQEM